MAAIGRGELAGHDMLRAMGIDVEHAQVKPARRRAAKAKQSDEKQAIPVRGATAHMALKYHMRTGAVPGERIVGILTPGEGITIYPIFAQALEQFDSQPERWVDLAWGQAEEGQRFPARVTVTIINEVGTLAQVAQAISDADANIGELHLNARAGVRDYFDLDILLEVFDAKHLNTVINNLKYAAAVSGVARVTG
jgi:GTP diphosphokinase / guanosine-3',5'-bis(diphosphate) 3'-diphosphatase